MPEPSPFVEHMRRLVAYHAWAGERLLEGAAALTSEQVHAPAPLSHASLFQSFRHVLDTAWSWRRAAQGEPDAGLLWEVEPLDHFDALRAFWRAENAHLSAFVDGLREADLCRDVVPAWKERPFQVSQILTHIVQHQTEHGNEIGWQLTRLGQSPGELAFLNWVDSSR